METKNAIGAKQAKDKVEDIANVLENKTETVKNVVSENISNIADQIQEKADSSQKFLDEKAKDVGKLIHQTVDKANKLGHTAADAITNSSEYIKNFDIASARESVKVAVTEKPEMTLIAVGLLGLIVGYLVGRKTA